MKIRNSQESDYHICSIGARIHLANLYDLQFGYFTQEISPKWFKITQLQLYLELSSINPKPTRTIHFKRDRLHQVESVVVRSTDCFLRIMNCLDFIKLV